MKNIKNIILLVFVLVMFSLTFSNCKGFGSPEYTMNVIIEDGCTGTPEAGSYTLNEFDEIEFQYFPPVENVVIEVLLNNSPKSTSGSIIVYNDITFTVRIKDIRGGWLFTYFIVDGTEVQMNITFAGDTPFAGTFTDSRGYSGTWTVESNVFTMTYSDWSDYVFTGGLSTMSGEYTGGGVQLSWSASRID